MEDRGKSVWVFDDDEEMSFVPMRTANKVYEISVPIGYSLVAHEAMGVVLQNIFNQMVSARRAYHLATGHINGFRFK